MPDIRLWHLHMCIFANTQVLIHRLYQHTNSHVWIQMLKQCPPGLWCIGLLDDFLKTPWEPCPYYSPAPDTSVPERLNPLLGCVIKTTLFPTEKAQDLFCQWHLLRRWQLAGTHPHNLAQFKPLWCITLANGFTLRKLAGSRGAQAWNIGLDTTMFLPQRVSL